jgi:hypothetical protein
VKRAAVGNGCKDKRDHLATIREPLGESMFYPSVASRLIRMPSDGRERDHGYDQEEAEEIDAPAGSAASFGPPAEISEGEDRRQGRQGEKSGSAHDAEGTDGGPAPAQGDPAGGQEGKTAGEQGRRYAARSAPAGR